MTSPICFWRTLWRSLRGQSISGCDYIEQTPAGGVLARVQVLKCETCGRTSVGWTPVSGETP